MSDRAVAAALDDVMEAVDDYRLDPTQENRVLLRERLYRFVKLVARHVGGQS